MDNQEQEKLELLLSELHRKEKITTHLKFLDEKLLGLFQRREQLHFHVEMEEADVNTLRENSLKSIYQRFLGNLEKELERENQEYLLAVLALHAVDDQIEVLQYEKEVLEKELINLHKIDDKVEEAFDDFEEKLKKKDPRFAKKMVDFERRTANSRALEKEISEAKMACVNCEVALLELTKEINKITGWGAYPNAKAQLEMSGKGRYSSYLKKKYIDKCRVKIHKVAASVDNLQKELNDLSERYQLDFLHSFEVLDNFLDTLYNFLITDWVVRKKIKATLNAIENFNDNFLRIKKMLVKKETQTREYLEEIEEKKRIFISTNYKSL